MKTLLVNDLKIRKKFIIAYFIFIVMIFSLKTIGLMKEEYSFFTDKPFVLVYLSAILVHFVLYVISSEGMIVDKSKSYFLCIGVSRSDIINVKFLKIAIIFIIDSLLMAYILQNVKLRGEEFEFGLFISLFMMAYYLIIIPIYLYFGQNSGVGTIFASSPAFLPFLDKLGKNPAGFFVGIIRKTSYFKLSLLLIIFVAAIYIISQLLGERKDY